MPHTALRRSHHDVPTPDGTADAYLSRPVTAEPCPPVLLLMDAGGLRPRLEQMADRLAGEGYAVLVPNQFYRAGRAPVVPDLAARLAAGDRAGVWAVLGPLIEGLTPELAARDLAAWVAFLDAQPDIATGPLATTGYCMGGALSLRAAATLPDRVVAAASFHGGHLAPDAEDGPHRGAPRIAAEVYVAHADDDPSMPPEQVERLEAALTDAGVRHTCEVYAGARHGFTMSDGAAYDPVAEERHWTALLGLLRRALPAA